MGGGLRRGRSASGTGADFCLQPGASKRPRCSCNVVAYRTPPHCLRGCFEIHYQACNSCSKAPWRIYESVSSSVCASSISGNSGFKRGGEHGVGFDGLGGGLVQFSFSAACRQKLRAPCSCATAMAARKACSAGAGSSGRTFSRMSPRMRHAGGRRSSVLPSRRRARALRRSD